MDRFPAEAAGELPTAPTGTVTFLFTDIEGSTRLLERLRGQYATVLAEQRDLLRSAFARWRGHEIDTQGDSFFVAFARAMDAVSCAIDSQRAVAEHAWPQGADVRVRMGLHTGEPMVGSTGYIGMDVHRAARIATAGHGGQVLHRKPPETWFTRTCPLARACGTWVATSSETSRTPNGSSSLRSRICPTNSLPSRRLA